MCFLLSSCCYLQRTDCFPDLMYPRLRSLRLPAPNSHIRRAMVSVMFASARRRRREVPDDEIGSNDQELELIGAQRPAVSLGRMRHREEAGEVGLAAVHGFASTDPAVCMMWCAIALGALLRGQPMEHVRALDGRSLVRVRARSRLKNIDGPCETSSCGSSKRKLRSLTDGFSFTFVRQVNRYVELAHDALTGCFDDDSIEAARYGSLRRDDSAVRSHGTRRKSRAMPPSFHHIQLASSRETC